MNNTEDHVPDIRSKRQLSLCEVEDYETGEFRRSTFAYIDEDEGVWFGQAPGIRKYDLTIEDIKFYLKRVPDETVFPQATSTITTLQKSSRRDYFIKRPKLLCLDNSEETKLLPQLFIEEAILLEIIDPHPNLIRYFGCTLKNGRVTGIALEKHPMILQYRYEDDPRNLDVGAVMKGIQAGVDHLHSLRLAHNDLNPTNIALDKEDNPIILDFGSCREFGTQLISAGTYGWIEEAYDKSSETHDKGAIQKIEEWLLKKQSERKADKQRTSF